MKENQTAQPIIITDKNDPRYYLQFRSIMNGPRTQIVRPAITNELKRHTELSVNQELCRKETSSNSE